MKTSNKTLLTYIFTCFMLLLGITFQSANAQDSWEEYGEAITAEGALNATEAIPHFTEEGENIKVQGTVTAVCDKVGCWAQFVTVDDQKIRIKFKDYSFFIPTESAGQTMIAEGIAFKDLKEEDSKIEYRLEAVGVLLKE